MTNREYLNQKKEAFYDKMGDIFEKYYKVFCGILYVAAIAAIICAVNISLKFLAIAIPLMSLDIVITISLIEIWLDKEHKDRGDVK
jgi:hypothetical protein